MQTQPAAVRRDGEAEVERDWRPGVDVVTLFAPESVNGLAFYDMRYAPGAEVELHRHAATADEAAGAASVEDSHRKDEYYLVRSGSAELTLGDDVHAIEAGDVVWIPRGTLHGVKAGADGLHLWALAAWLEHVEASLAPAVRA